MGCITRKQNKTEHKQILKNSVNSVSADVLGLAHLAGFDVAMSLILGAIVTRLTLNSQKLMLKKA